MSDKSTEVNFEFRQRLNKIIGGNHHNFCYQCGACVSLCPTAKYSTEFNPRTIMLMALLGLEDKLIAPDSIIWKCTNCYTCYERCPQDVRPVDVITALKNICVAEDRAPDIITRYSAGILDTGVSTPLSAAIVKRREKFGLPKFNITGYDEMKIILDREDNK